MNGKPKPTSGKKRRSGKNIFTTKSGTAIKLNRSLGERIKASRDARARRRAAYLSTLPKDRFKRILFRLHPRQLARYWFSRDGAIMALKITGIALVIGFALIVGIFAYFRKDLPNINDLSGQTLGGSNTYRDRTDTITLWEDYDAVKRRAVNTEEMSKTVRDATVAIEDQKFYEHGAFDVRGILRAGINNVFNRGGGVQGGSTISQQLVKLDQKWTAERNIGNKIKEVILAIEMEREYSKEDILTGYLNAAPYGPVSVGVQVASEDYFGVNAKDLSIPQAAVLAAIPKSPSIYSPYGPSYDPDILLARQRYIIDQMAKQKMITKQQATEAKAVDILAQIKPQKPSLYTGIKAPWFVLAAKAELMEKYGDKTVQRGGWKIITTVDMRLQDLADKKVADAMPLVRKRNGNTAAFVAIDNKTGQVVALVGGSEFGTNPDHGELNFAHSYRVSPGSTFKPYDYAALIENNNAGAGSVLYDSYTSLPGWPCNPKTDGGNKCLRDYDYKTRTPPGPITLRYSLGGSRNIPAVKAMLSAVPNDTSPDRIASVNKTIDMTEAMMGTPYGYACFEDGTDVSTVPRKTQGIQCRGSSAIGDGAYLFLDDHATGLSTFARMGQHLPHTYILKITDSSNKVVDEFKQPKPKQVIRPDTAYIINDMAADPNASYLGRKFQRYKPKGFNENWNFAVKTGTTNDSFDGLMSSWSTQYTAVTWVGHHTRTVALKGFMEDMTTPIMRGWMEAAHDGLKPVNWEKPSGIKTLPAFVITTHVGASSKEPSTSTDIYPSWYNPPKNGGDAQTIDLITNKTATDCTPELARSKTEGASHNTFSVDVFMGANPGGAATQTADSVDDVHSCNDTKPQITLSVPPTCEDENDCIFTVAVTKGTHALSGGSYTAAPASRATLLVNGQAVETIEIPAASSDVWNYSFAYSPAAAGNAEVQVQVVDSVLYSETTPAEAVQFTN